MTLERAAETDFPVFIRTCERLAAILPALVLAYPLLIWPLVYAVPVVDETNLRAPSSALGDFLLNKIYFPGLLVLGAVCALACRRPMTKQTFWLIATLALYLGFCAASAMWSLAPGITLRRALLEAMVCSTLIFAVLCVPRPASVLGPIAWLMFAVLAVNLLRVLTVPAGPIGHEGIYQHKNTLGATAGLAIVLGIYTMFQVKPATRVAALLSSLIAVFLLLQSQSKTATILTAIAPLAGLVFYFLCKICRIPFALALLVPSILVLFGSFVVFDTIEIQYGDIFEWLFGDRTFTGRTLIWQFTWEHFRERPWLGYGYSGFWDIGPQSPKLAAPNFIAKMAHAHNGYLNTMLETGLIGLTLLLTVVAVWLIMIGRLALRDPPLFIFAAALATYVLVTNLMESDILVPMSAASSLLLVMAALAAGREGGRP